MVKNLAPVLRASLEEAQTLGFIGGTEPELHIRHALAFGDVLRVHGFVPESAGDILDLGSGGGLPGLVLASLFPQVRICLLDASLRRTEFLSEAVHRCGFDGRVVVLRARAEEAARDDRYRGRFGAVVARSFGSPGTTAECAAGFLQVNGLLVVSEPPAASGDEETVRWDDVGLSHLGMRSLGRAEEAFGYQVLFQETPCPDRFPRKMGLPAKRPLF